MHDVFNHISSFIMWLSGGMFDLHTLLKVIVVRYLLYWTRSRKERKFIFPYIVKFQSISHGIPLMLQDRIMYSIPACYPKGSGWSCDGIHPDSQQKNQCLTAWLICLVLREESCYILSSFLTAYLLFFFFFFFYLIWLWLQILTQARNNLNYFWSLFFSLKISPSLF